MKYREVYLALNQRKLDAPGFHYSDYSGWQAANQSYMTRQRPLWIVAEDPASSRRMWICHDGSVLSVRRAFLWPQPSFPLQKPHGIGCNSANSFFDGRICCID